MVKKQFSFLLCVCNFLLLFLGGGGGGGDSGGGGGGRGTLNKLYLRKRKKTLVDSCNGRATKSTADIISR